MAFEWSSPGGGSSVDYGDVSKYADDSSHFTGNIPQFTATPSGTGAIAGIRAAAGSAAHPGAIRLATGTTTTGSANLCSTNIDDQVKLGGGQTTFTTVVNLSALSDGTNTYAALCGITSPAYSATLSITAGIYFYIDSNANANWRIRCTSSSVTTDGDTGVAATAAWVKLAWVLNAAGTSVQAYINGTAAGSPVTTNIPTAGLMLQWFIKKAAGATSVNFDVDAYRFLIELATPL